MHAEQRLGVVVSMGLLHAPLESQKRGALHEKDRERAQSRVTHAVSLVLARAAVGQLGQRIAHALHHPLEINRLALNNSSHHNPHEVPLHSVCALLVKMRIAVVLRATHRDTTAQDIIDWCHDNMAVYKAPRAVQFVDVLPKSGTGKVMWRALQETELSA